MTDIVLAEQALAAAHQKLAQARDELEERVKELAQANRDLQHEIAQHKQTEQSLRESEARFRTLAETTAASIMIIQKSQIRYINTAGATMSGYTSDELLAMPFWELASPEHHPLFKKTGNSVHTSIRCAVTI